MRKMICLALFSLSGIVYGNMGPTGFSNFPNHYFVETGTAGGNGIELARKTGLFTEIYSMEIDESHIAFARSRFPFESHIHIIHGDSSRDLEALIKPFDRPITFWLDAHHGEPSPGRKSNLSLMQELDQIRRHPIKVHTILIDDLHCCGTVLFDFLTREQIVQKVLQINPSYNINYINGGDEGEYPNNILVARVKSEDPEEFLKDAFQQGIDRKKYLSFAECLRLMYLRNVQTIVETRPVNKTNDAEDSTTLFTRWAEAHRAKLHSLERQNSIQNLKNFPSQIDFLYISSYRADEESNGASRQHVLNEVIAAHDKLAEHAIVVLNNCNSQDGANGKLAIEFLLQKGWVQRTNQNQIIFLRK